MGIEYAAKRRKKKSVVSWSTIQKMEQSRWLRFAREHRDEPICAAAIKASEVSQATAAQMARLAAQKNWEIPSVGQAAARRRKRARAT